MIKFFSVIANDIVAKLEALVGADKLSADAIKDGTTNKAYTAIEKTKLAGVAENADVTTAASIIAAGAYRIGTNTMDDIANGTTNKLFSATEKAKLSGIEALADVTDATNVAAAGAFMKPKAGDLDKSTFNTTGMVVTDLLGASDIGKSVAIQSDGKIVITGYSNNGVDNDFAVVRYNVDGSLDTTFGTGGKVATDFGTSDDYGMSVAIQTDGKIVVAGYSNWGGDNDFAVARYETNGSLDTSFNTDGKVTVDFGYANDSSVAIAIQSDGKIVIAGSSYNGTDNDFGVMRFNNNGVLDTAFDVDGAVNTPVGTGDDIGYSVAIQTDGKIIVAGKSNNGTNDDFAIVRYNTNGSLDTTFGTTGIITTPIGTGDDVGYSVAIQSDGKIVVAGSSNNGSNDDFAIVRYNTNGTLDTTFGTTGKITTPIGTASDVGYSVAIQTDGKIVVAGKSNNGANNDFAVVRYNTNGSLDTTFGTTGKVTIPIGTANDVGYSVAIQSDGKIVVTGGSNNGVNDDFAVVRLHGDTLGYDTLDYTPNGVINKAFTATMSSKLAGIEALADVTDSTNVDAAGATMNTDLVTVATASSPVKTLASGLIDPSFIGGNYTKEPTGFVNDTDSVLTWKDTSPDRTLTITGTNFVVFSAGNKILKNTESIQIPNTPGLYFVYYNNDASYTLTATISSSIPDLFGEGRILISTVYWNGTEGLATSERHLCKLNAHEYLHKTIGARYEAGGFTGTFTNTTLSILKGVLWDDFNLKITTPGTTTQVPIFYRNGSVWNWTALSNTVHHIVSTHVQYDNAGTMASAAGDYVAYWIFATNNINYPLISVMGQRKDTNITNARANNTYESLSFGVLPFAEYKILYRVIVRDDATPYEETQDLRGLTNVSSGTYVATSHGTLTNLDHNDHPQYALDALMFRSSHSVTAGEVSAHLVDIDTGFTTAPLGWIVQIYRAGVDIKADAIITNPATDIIRIADGGATYDTTEGDVIKIFAWQ